MSTLRDAATKLRHGHYGIHPLVAESLADWLETLAAQDEALKSFGARGYDDEYPGLIVARAVMDLP